VERRWAGLTHRPTLPTCSGAIAWLVGLALCGAGFAVPAAAYLDPDFGDPVDRPGDRVDCLAAVGPGSVGRLDSQTLSAAGFPDPSFGCPSMITSTS
jgi:hypothetical protein